MSVHIWNSIEIKDYLLFDPVVNIYLKNTNHWYWEWNGCLNKDLHMYGLKLNKSE